MPCRVLSCRDMSDNTSRLIMQIVTCDKRPTLGRHAPLAKTRMAMDSNAHLTCIALDVRDRAHLRCFSTCRPTIALGCEAEGPDFDATGV